MANLLNDLKTKTFVFTEKGGGGRVLLDVFAGELSASYMANGQRKANVLVRDDDLLILQHFVRKMLESGGGEQRWTITFTRWDRQAKKSEIRYVLTLGVGEDRIPFFEWNFGNGNKVSTTLPPIRTADIGSEKLKSADQSHIRLRELLHHLVDEVPREKFLTSSRGKKDGGGAPPSGGGGNEPAAPQPASSGGEDIPF